MTPLPPSMTAMPLSIPWLSRPQLQLPWIQCEASGMRTPNPAGSNLDIVRLTKMAREAMRKNAPKSVASMTGGEYELFTSSKNFEKFMTEFTNHLHSRYL